METLFESDCNAFGRAPAFASDGTCRMKFDGADKFKWDDILSVAPKAIEWLSPATFCSNFAFAGFLIFVVVDFLNGMLYGDVKDVFFQLYIYMYICVLLLCLDSSLLGAWLGMICFFPTCQVRVVRFYVSLSFSSSFSSSSFPSSSSSSPPLLLSCAGPQRRFCVCSVPRRTSTAIL